MKALYLKVSTAVFMLASVFATTPAFAGHILDFQILGRGTVVQDCAAPAPSSDCVIELSGQASGTHVGHDDFNLTLNASGSSERHNNGAGGFCTVVTGTLTLNPPSAGTTIESNVVGTICEERQQGSPVHFNGTYRITGGSASFANALGGGSVTATYLRGSGGLVTLHGKGTLAQP